MKNKKKFWRGFWYGFTITAIVLAAIGVCVYGMVRAEKNTRATGFGDTGDSRIIYVNGEEGIVRLFGKEWQLQ